MCKPLENWVIIKPDIDGSEKIGNLELETSYDNEQFSITKGTVYSVPDRLFFDKKNKSRSMQWHTSLEVKEGDIAHFHYLSSINSLGAENRTINIDGELHILIKYESIFIVERGEEVIPINGYLLLEPIQKDVGNLLFDSDDLKRHKNLARIVYAGTPNKEYLEPFYKDWEGLNVGDVVVMKNYCNTFIRNEIFKDKLNLFRAQRRDVIGTVNM